VPFGARFPLDSVAILLVLLGGKAYRNRIRLQFRNTPPIDLNRPGYRLTKTPVLDGLHQDYRLEKEVHSGNYSGPQASTVNVRSKASAQLGSGFRQYLAPIRWLAPQRH
jgi:hypothetical protein